jgi:hypothetical protein
MGEQVIQHISTQITVYRVLKPKIKQPTKQTNMYGYIYGDRQTTTKKNKNTSEQETDNWANKVKRRNSPKQSEEE